MTASAFKLSNVQTLKFLARNHANVNVMKTLTKTAPMDTSSTPLSVDVFPSQPSHLRHAQKEQNSSATSSRSSTSTHVNVNASCMWQRLVKVAVTAVALVAARVEAVEVVVAGVEAVEVAVAGVEAVEAAAARVEAVEAAAARVGAMEAAAAVEV